MRGEKAKSDGTKLAPDCETRSGTAAGAFSRSEKAEAPWLCLHSILVTPVGMVCKSKGNSLQPSHLEGVKRGPILGFSKEAAKRMREWMILMHVPGSQMVETTFTIPGKVTPKEWRKALRNLTKYLLKIGSSAVWRVELQRRKQPHLHLLGYAKDHLGIVVFAAPDVWLSCLPERCRKVRGARQYAVKGTLRHVDTDLRWLAYCVGHGTKKKADQLGWQGKQWGIIGRANFEERPAVKVEHSDQQNRVFKRTMMRYLRSKSDCKKRKKIRPCSSRLAGLEVTEKLLTWISQAYPKTTTQLIK